MEKKKDIKAKTKDIRISIPVKFKIIKDDKKEEGIIEAYVSIFDNVDLVGDIIKKGAFAESLKKKLPKGVWAHNWEEPVAKTLEAREDDKGLYIKGQFIKGVQKAEEAYKLIKNGVIDEFSIGFRILEYEWDADNADIRIIKKAKLYEWSPVLAGANPDTELISIKGEKKAEQKIVKNMTSIPTKKVDFVKIDEKKGEVKLFYKNEGMQYSAVLKLSNKYKKYLQERKALNKKVGTNTGEGKATHKILRIRQVAKQNLKANQYLLKITK